MENIHAPENIAEANMNRQPTPPSRAPSPDVPQGAPGQQIPQQPPPQQPAPPAPQHQPQQMPYYFPQPFPQQGPQGAPPMFYFPQNFGASAVTMPARNSGSAPKFDSKNPRDLLRYFAEVELLLNAANIHDDQAKKDHTKRYLSSQDFEIWDALPESRLQYTYAAFKAAVVASYPGEEADKKYSWTDIDRLTENRRTAGISSTTELGEYYRDFRTITSYLMSRNKMAEMETRRAFVSGFPRELLVRVAHKLQVTFPDLDPDDGYPVSEIYRAAVFLLQGSSFFPQDMYGTETSYMTPMPASTPAPTTNFRPSATPVAADPTMIKQEDLYAFLDRFAKSIATTVTASVGGNRPPASTSQPQSTPATASTAMPTRRAFIGEGDRCNFCGEMGHFIANCPTADQYLREGKVTRRPDGRLGLPNGHFVPRSIEGQWLKDRLDTWWIRQLGSAAPGASSTQQNPSSTMFYSLASDSGGPTSINEVQMSFCTTMMQSSGEEEVDARIRTLQQEIFALQTRQGKKRQIEILKRPAGAQKGHMSKNPPILPVVDENRTVPTANETQSTTRSEAPKAKTVERQSDKLTSSAGPSKVTTPAAPPGAAVAQPAVSAEPPTHPYEKAKDAHYIPPVDRNFGAPFKPKDKDTTYQTLAPIQDPKFIETVLDRSLKDTRITISLEELLSLSPDLRYRVKERVTAKRFPAAANKAQVHFADTEGSVIEEIMSHAVLENYSETPVEIQPGVYRIPDIAQTFYSAPDLRDKVILRSAKESHALRAIHMELADKAQVECILDPGSMIVAMLDAVSHQLGIPYDPEIKLQMQSANGEYDSTLGLACNVPFRFNDITLLIQCHVVQSPAYDILMGRPFDVLTSSVVRNYDNAEQTITITDPNSGKVYTIPTIERGPPRFQMMRAEKDFRQASRN